jgi:hypothetical protein
MKVLSYMDINKRRIAGFIIMIIGAILFVMLVNSMAQDVPVWVFGRRVNATIVEKWWENLDMENLDGNYIDIEYFFGYQFITNDGETVIGKSKVTVDEFMGYQEGGEIMIKYSPLNPSDNRLDDSRFMPFLLCSYIPFILISIFSLVAGRELIDF